MFSSSAHCRFLCVCCSYSFVNPSSRCFLLPILNHPMCLVASLSFLTLYSSSLLLIPSSTFPPSLTLSLSLWGVSMLPPGVFKVLLQIVDQLEWLHEGGRGCVCVWWMIVWLCLEIDESHFSLDRGAGPQWQHTDMHTHYKPKQTFFVCSITILNWTKDTWNLITAVFVVVL